MRRITSVIAALLLLLPTVTMAETIIKKPSGGSVTITDTTTSTLTAGVVLSNGSDLDSIAILTSVSGGTGNGFTKFSGPATAERTFTLPNASSTIATGTGTANVVPRWSGTGGTMVDTSPSLTCDGTTCTFGGPIVGPNGTVTDPSFVPGDGAGFYRVDTNATGVTGGTSNASFMSFDYGTTGLRLRDGWGIAWDGGTALSGALTAGSVFAVRDGSYSLGFRNGANALRLSVYGTFTDASNYERLALTTTAGSGVSIIAETAGTGGDNLNITLTPAGTGVVIAGNGVAGPVTCTTVTSITVRGGIITAIAGAGC